MWQLDAEGNVIGNQKAIGGKSVGIPGNVKGMEYAFEKYGSGNVTWEEVIAPSVKLAEEGYIVTPTLYNDMFGSYDAMVNYPEFGNVYLNADGLNYQVGDTFKNPDLAKTLKAISDGGADAFYTGAIAQKMVDTVNKYGGLFTMDDLANYEVKVMEPVTGTYRGYKIISSPLPSSGGTHVIEALNIMENFDIASMGFDSAEKLHIMTEAFKMCFHDREEFMGDPMWKFL
jgi:gamma-glutamyltranspeptidase/glutathione hydrolase